MTKTQNLVFVQVRKGFSVHTLGCQGYNAKQASLPVSVEEINEEVADAQERGFKVYFCSCTGR